MRFFLVFFGSVEAQLEQSLNVVTPLVFILVSTGTGSVKSTKKRGSYSPE